MPAGRGAMANGSSKSAGWCRIAPDARAALCRQAHAIGIASRHGRRRRAVMRVQ
jgi:hypothetical protein